MTQENLGSFILAVPPSKKDKALIANFLNHETAQIDTLIEKQQNLIALLKEKRQAVISHAVTKGLNPDVPMKDSGVEWLGDVPAHWGIKRFKFLCNDIIAGPFGSSITKDMYIKEGYKVYGQEQVIPDDFKIGDYYISEASYKDLSLAQISKILRHRRMTTTDIYLRSIVKIETKGIKVLDEIGTVLGKNSKPEFSLKS